MSGDHAEFEKEWAASGRPREERPDWPLPSFDARDWAKAFIKANPVATEEMFDAEGTLIAWFANALMRGYEEGIRSMSQSNAIPHCPACGEVVEPGEAAAVNDTWWHTACITAEEASDATTSDFRPDGVERGPPEPSRS